MDTTFKESLKPFAQRYSFNYVSFTDDGTSGYAYATFVRQPDSSFREPTQESDGFLAQLAKQGGYSVTTVNYQHGNLSVTFKRGEEQSLNVMPSAQPLERSASLIEPHHIANAKTTAAKALREYLKKPGK